jgi:hypothetical protein
LEPKENIRISVMDISLRYARFELQLPAVPDTLALPTLVDEMIAFQFPVAKKLELEYEVTMIIVTYR